MMDIYEEVAKLKAELEYLDNHRNHLVNMKEDLKTLEEELKSKEKILKKENDDVEKLEKTTILSLFYKLAGDIDEKMEKERHEAMQASIEYHRILNDFEIMQSQAKRLEERYQDEKKIEERLKSLQLEVLQEQNPLQKEILDKEIAEYERLQKLMKEIDEALQAGELVQESIEDVLMSLSKAQSWGVYDMIGGGFVSTAIKHNHIDNAQRQIQNVYHQMKQFEKEVQDVEEFKLEINEIAGGLVMADYIFDNILSDWLVQSKIDKNKRSVEESKRQVDSTMEVLRQRKQENSDQMIYVQKKINNILKDN